MKVKCGPTHHNACACREAYFKMLEKQNRIAATALVSIAAGRSEYGTKKYWIKHATHKECAEVCANNAKVAKRAAKQCLDIGLQNFTKNDSNHCKD